MSLGNPYYIHPQLATRLAADDVLLYLSHHSSYSRLLEQGKMLGILVIRKPFNDDESHIIDTLESKKIDNHIHYINNIYYIAAYSGVLNDLNDEDCFFVPPVYDLQKPDDFYLSKDAEISAINQEILNLETLSTSLSKFDEKNIKRKINELKNLRKNKSISLQKEIFSHFTFQNHQHQYRNIIEIFADSKRGLPPGGSGECAAPRLLQYAFEHNLEPVELSEFWYGSSPKNIQRIHGHFYPSCIEKCAPILSYMLPSFRAELHNNSILPHEINVIFEDDHLLVLEKPKDLLSTMAKDLDAPNLEMFLHEKYPLVKGPMLVHRLDQATSGIMLAAKDAETYKRLQMQFENKEIQKRYVASVNGIVLSDCGIINLPLTVNPNDRPRQVVDWQFGKKATTYYQVVSRGNSSTLLLLFPLTGRTHQLRLHCASSFGLGHAIVGDTLYCQISDDIEKSTDEKLNSSTTLHLHAESISFTHPYSGKPLTFTWKEEEHSCNVE